MLLSQNNIVRLILGFSIVCICFTAAASEAYAIESKMIEAREKSAAKDFEGAIVIYDSILKDNPENTDVLNAKARVLSWMGRFDESRSVYQKVLLKDPDNIDSLIGVADTYAWQRDYGKAVEILEKLLKNNPTEREVLIRLARFNLWSKRKNDTLKFTERILKDNPEDSDALGLKNNALSLYNYEFFTGYYFLNINNNVDSHNIYSGFKYKPGKNYSFYGQVDYLDRFKKTEGRLFGGGSLKLTDKHILSVEVGLSPDAEVYPVFSGLVELSYITIPSLTIHGRLNLSNFSNTDLYGFSLAGEYYPYGYLSVLLRLTFTKTEFDNGGSSTDDAQMLKITYYINDTNKIYTYVAKGNEAFRIETVDRIGGISASIIGLGGTYFITPVIGISPSFEYQDREGGTKYLQFGVEFKYRW